MKAKLISQQKGKDDDDDEAQLNKYDDEGK